MKNNLKGIASILFGFALLAVCLWLLWKIACTPTTFIYSDLELVIDVVAIFFPGIFIGLGIHFLTIKP